MISKNKIKKLNFLRRGPMRQGRSIISFILFLGVLVPINAVERALIDFTTFNENIQQVMSTDQELFSKIIEEHPDLDIRNFGWPDFTFEPDDWNISNWKVVLNPSASTTYNKKYSMVKNSPSKEYGNVLGLRLHFQPWRNPFWASITMPFLLAPTYVNGQYISQNTNGEDAGLAIGLLANVGQIKNVRSWAYGLNYNYTYGVRTSNERRQIREYGMGSVFYEGWRRLGWNNPDYTENPNDWTPVKNPLYPYMYPPQIELNKGQDFKQVGEN